MPTLTNPLQIAYITTLWAVGSVCSLAGQDSATPNAATSAEDPPARRIEKPVFPQSGNADTFILEADTYTLRELVDRSAAFLRCNDLVSWDDPELAKRRSRKQPQGDEGDRTVTLQTRVALDREGCIATISQLLGSHGWVRTCVDPGRELWEWVNLNTSKRSLISSRALNVDAHELQLLRGRQAWVYHSFQPKKQTAATLLAQLLRPMQVIANEQQMPPLVVQVGTELLLFGDVRSIAKIREFLVKMDIEADPSELLREPQRTSEIEQTTKLEPLAEEAKRVRNK